MAAMSKIERSAELAKRGVRWMADMNFKHIYPGYAKVMSGLTDFEFSLSDVKTLSVYATELYTLRRGLRFLGSIYNSNETDDQSKTADSKEVTKTGAVLAAASAVVSILIISQYFRTRVDEKMGIKANRDFPADDDLRFLISELNTRKDVQALSFDEVVPLAHRAVDDFTYKYEGVRISSTKRVKRSLLSDLNFWRSRTVASFNPVFQEVVFNTDKFPEAITHEFAHSKAIPQERLAQLVSVASQIESDHPYLQYLGYFSWLRILIQSGFLPDLDLVNKEGMERVNITSAYLDEKGLNPRTSREIYEKMLYLDETNKKTMSYSSITNRVVNLIYDHLPSAIQNRIPEVLLTSLRSPERSLSGLERRIILALTRQNIQKSYSEDPAALLHDYRKKYIQNTIDL